jgi:uncharacterized membrane protein YedE/YeeE
MKRLFFALFAGALFGFGLAVSQMTDPDKVLNFLDVTGHWDPSLALVMASALAVSLPGYALMQRRGRTLRGDALPPAPGTRIDARLIGGSVLFGIGWGIAGFCPGPALANLAHLTLEPLVFVASVLAGSQVLRWLEATRR